MGILIFLISLSVFIIVLRSANFRKGLTNSMLIVRYALEAAVKLLKKAAIHFWSFMKGNAAPASGATIGSAAPWIILLIAAVVILVIIPLLLLLIFPGLILIVIGVASGNTLIAFSVLILLLISWILYIPSRLLRTAWIARQIFVNPLIIGLIGFLAFSLGWSIFGLISPRGHSSIERSASNHTASWWNSLDRGSMASEEESGDFVRVILNTRQYNDNGISLKSLKVGDTVEILDYKGKKKSKDSEGMIFVRTPNDDGDFFNGQRGWVPSRALDLAKKTSPVSPGGPREITLGDSRVINGKTVYIAYEVFEPGKYRIDQAANVDLPPYETSADRKCDNGYTFDLVNKEKIRFASLKKHLVVSERERF
ncbi:MAG TPA: hypothetical protein VK255_04570 [Patescibacteria group bacterium]|nr:hypothetical protein [Patescibacteria group bacterium]